METPKGVSAALLTTENTLPCCQEVVSTQLSPISQISMLQVCDIIKKSDITGEGDIKLSAIPGAADVDIQKCDVSSDIIKECDIHASVSCAITNKVKVPKATVLIPKPSIFTANLNVFSDLATFSQVTGYKPLSTIVLVQTKLPGIMNQVRALSNLFRKTKKSVITSTTRNGYSALDERPVHEYFCSEMLEQWRQKKAVLLAEIEKHKDALWKLSLARKIDIVESVNSQAIKHACWRTEAKVKKYRLIIDTQTSALQHNPSETKVRTASLKKMQSILARKQDLHEQTTSSFLDKFLLEVGRRETVKNLSEGLEREIVEVMENSIARLMKLNRQNLSAEKVREYAQMIYRMTCRSYQFDIVMPEPCEKIWIGETTCHGSQLTRKAMLKLKC